MKHPCKRLTALLLALAMSLSMLSMTAWAAEPEEETEVSVSSEAEPEEEAAEEESEAEPEEEADEEESEAEPEEEADEEESEAEPEEEAAEEESEAEAEEAANNGISVASEDGIATVSTVASGTCGDNLTWTLDSTGTLTISGSGAMTNWTSSDAPWYDYGDEILNIVIGDGVTSIGSYAFYDLYWVESVDFGNGVTSIGDYAFCYCWSLQSIDLPEGVETIGDYAFYYCDSLQSIDLPESMDTIGDYAFYECMGMTSAYLGGTTEIGDSAFEWCISLTDVSWSGVTSIGARAFITTGINGSFTIGYSITYIGEYALGYYDGDTGFGKYENLIIYGYADTAAETYAEENGFTFVNRESDDSTDSSTVTLATPVLTLTNVNGGVTVTWDAVSGAEQYRVYRRVIGGDWEVLTDTTATSYTDTTAVGGTLYYYTVRCVNAAGTAYTSDYEKNKAIKYLATPSLSVANASSGVTVTWGSVSGASKYRVYRRVVGGDWEVLGEITSTGYTDTTAKSGTIYYYTVRALSGSYSSSYEKNKGIKYLATPSLSIANASSGVSMKWGSVTGASKYRVYRRVAGSNSTWEVLGEVTSTSYTDTTAVNGTIYYYTVRALSGSYSSYYEKNTAIVRLTTPTLSSVTNSASKTMTAKWSKASSITGYQVRYSTSSSFSNSTTVTVSSASTVSKTASGLTKGETYYVVVRTYKILSGKVYYSAWSSAKTVKISK